ncbi:MAG TPA: helix-turn-helix domain-containing protein [Isosphaeraceae bacterium]|nr:helix-turn-helix domain-containing protein [Isosphaeraceae bacterium]
MERANIERALARCNGQVYGNDGAAALLGMKPTTLWSRLRSLGISTERS